MLNSHLQKAVGQKGINRHVEKIEYRMTPTEFKRWRQLHGWTEDQAARQLGLDRATVVQYESIGKIPKAIELICEKINY
jgi:DNA-binding XRE family transcriptional regulator